MDTMLTTTNPETVNAAPQSNRRSIYLGYVLLFLSAGMFALFSIFGNNNDSLAVFFIHYAIAASYACYLVYNKSIGFINSWQRDHIDQTVITVNLFLVSAYALNRQLVVFESSVNWYCVYLIITSATLLSLRYANTLPRIVNTLQFTVLGAAMVLYAYMTLYVAPFYIIGSIGSIAIGIGAHIFVPFLLLITSITLYRHSAFASKSLWVSIGIVASIVITVAFVVTWVHRVKQVERFSNQSVLHESTDLPVWVQVGQILDNDWISERILKAGIVYTSARQTFFDFDFTPSTNWDEAKKHDPLVYIASIFARTSLSTNDRIQLLKSIAGSHHSANERLWSGNHLSTSYIVSDIDLYPQLHIAYSEHYLNVRNNNTWENNEEGIYTFYLPEGSVVTSLSLWINGQEQKGILTSKHKANKAYQTIVGYERRDPSLVEWQEGNTVTVRVFPCTPSEERKFKIGITSPLEVRNHDLYYNTITFDGPSAISTRETRRVRIVGDHNSALTLPGFEKTVAGDYIRESDYDESFVTVIPDPGVKGNQFTFDGNAYSIQPYVPTLGNAKFESVFLDINKSWSDDELEAFQHLTYDHPIYVYVDNEMVQLNTVNWGAVTAQLQQQNFSLFPFYKLKTPTQTLVITKGSVKSPHLADVKDYPFVTATALAFTGNDKPFVFNLEGGTSTYIKTLHELRRFNFASGSPDTILKYLTSGQFPQDNESTELVNIHTANISIKRTTATTGSPVHNTAPDHLARLFAYNDVMRQAGPLYFKNEYIDDALVTEAAKAYVVSPVSSLIVLETQEDYKRFDINETENSLHNASKQSSGAVPEPHEWALIALFGLLVIYLIKKS